MGSYVGDFKITSNNIAHELLVCLLILPVRPGLRHFRPVALLMKETMHGLVRALHTILVCNVAMEWKGVPKSFLRTTQLLELFQISSFCAAGMRGLRPGLFFATRPSTPYEIKAFIIFFTALSERSNARMACSRELPVRRRIITVHRRLVSLFPARWVA